MASQFYAPPPEELSELARKWAAVERVVEDEYQIALGTDLADLDVLQRLVNDKVINEGAYALQCLGCVLGRIMVDNIPGLDWALVEDEYGADMCLRYADTSLCVFPLTMIAKRIERREEVSVAQLYEQTRAHIERVANAVD